MDGKTIVSVAGSAVPVGVPLACKSVTVTALPANTGLIAVGRAPEEYPLVGSSGKYSSQGPDATNHKGILLEAGQSILLEVKVSTDLWVDAAVSAEGVAWSVEPACCSGCSGGPASQVTTESGVQSVQRRGGGCCGR